MRATKKQLLGFGGLALVVGLTTVAYNLPASAETAVDGNVEVVVQVYNINFETVIEQPQDGDIYTDANVSFQEIHSKAKNVKYYLTFVAADGTKTAHELSEYEVVSAGDPVDGVTKFNLNLDEFGGYGTYIFESRITGFNDEVRTDHVQFTYAAIRADQKDVSLDEAKDETDFRVYYSAGVKSLTYQLYDTNGNAVSKVFSAVTDNPERGGYLDLSAALSGLNLPAGRYFIRITGYSSADASGNVLGTASVYFDYAGASPNVPDTGSILSALNISKADYLITGLIGFGLISIIAFFVVKRSGRRE